MDISWDDARLFLAVADSGSLSAAAKKLRVAQPTVSRRLAELEASLGEPLFVRSVEGATPTSFAEKLLVPARRMAEWAAELAHAAEKADASPRGVVRITAPPGVAFDVGAPFAALVRKKLPEVRLEIVSTVRYLDLSRREADLALRTQAPVQKDLAILASLSLSAVPFVSAEYAAALPRRPKVADVDWIGWAPPFDDMQPNAMLSRVIPEFRPSFASDDFLVQLRAAENGLGAIFLGRVRHRLSPPPRLVEITLADLQPIPSALHLVCAKSALGIPRIRAVADMLASELAHADTGKHKRR